MSLLSRLPRSSRWWLARISATLLIFGATLLSYAVALTTFEMSPILLVPGVGSALLALYGRSLWPCIAVGDAVGQMVMNDRAWLAVALTVMIHVIACVLCAAWLRRTDLGLRTLASTSAFVGISAAVSLVGGMLTTAVLVGLDEIPPGYEVPEIGGWVAMGYMTGFLVGGGFVLAWGNRGESIAAAFHRPIAIAGFVMVIALAGLGFLAEVGVFIPLALLGAIAVAGRAGARWGSACMLSIALIAIYGAHRGIAPPFGGQDPAEHAANAMLAISLFAAAALMLAGYREGGEDRARSPVVVALVFGALMLVAGVTALAANEVALNQSTPFVLSGLLSLGAGIGLALLRISRAPAKPSSRRGIAWAAVAGAIYVVNLALYLQAVPMIGSGPATGLTMTAPLAIVVMGAVIYRTRPSAWIIVAVAVIVTGALFIASEAMSDPAGVALALSSAVVFGASVMFTKQALTHANVVDVALASAAAAATVALIVGVIVEGISAFSLTASEYGALVLAALGAQLVPTLGRSWALSRISADVVGAEGVLAPVTTTVLSFFFLDAATTGGDVVGLVLIATGAVIAALLGSRATGAADMPPAPSRPPARPAAAGA